MRWVHCWAVAGVLLLVGCRRGEQTRRATNDRPRDPVPFAEGGWVVTERSFGPVRVGMTVAEARTALGAELPDPQDTECDFVAPRDSHSGVDFMVVDGRLARIDVQDTAVATAAGARIGDSEARVEQLYHGRVSVEPHKYIVGHYLVVRSLAPADSAFRLVFETDGNQVIEYRAGQLPQVRWLEGCG